MRWLNPRDPRGTTTWGTIAMCALIAVLFKSHGAPSEVWPNRCALLRAQLMRQPVYALSATLPELSEAQLIPRSVRSIEVQAPLEDGTHSGGPSLRLTLRGSSDEWLTAELYPISDEGLVQLSEKLAIHLNPLPSHPELTRQGLKVSPDALTCASEFSSTEQSLALGLLLKGGILRDAPEGVEGFGFQGERGWFARWRSSAPISWRLWMPIPGEQGHPTWLMVWTRRFSPQAQPTSSSPPEWVGASHLQASLQASSLVELSEGLLALLTPFSKGQADRGHQAGITWLRRASHREPTP